MRLHMYAPAGTSHHPGRQAHAKRRFSTRPRNRNQRPMLGYLASAVTLAVALDTTTSTSEAAGTAATRTSSINVPKQVSTLAVALCRSARLRYPPLVQHPAARRLVMIYTATRRVHRQLGSTPAYLDCGANAWRSPGPGTPTDIVECTRAAGRCADAGLHGLVVDPDAGSGDGVCTAAVVIRPRRRNPTTFARLWETLVHEYVIHCGLRTLGGKNRTRVRSFLANRIAPDRINGWFGNASRANRYRKKAAHRRGFSGKLELPILRTGNPSPDACGPTFKSKAQRTAYLWYVEEALAKLVSEPLSKGYATMLAARGPKEAFAARLAINLDSFAAGLITGADVMRPITGFEPPLLGCAAGTTLAESERRARRAEAERRKREEDRARHERMARGSQRLERENKASHAKGLMEYIGAIQSSVTRNWRRPTGVPRGLKCTVTVVQASNGKVLRVEITQSSGNVAFDRSIEQAVLAASPLPLPRDRAMFEREIIFMFNPRG